MRNFYIYKERKNGSYNTLHFFYFVLKTQNLYHLTFYAKEKYHLRSISISLYIRATILYAERPRNTYNAPERKVFSQKTSL